MSSANVLAPVVDPGQVFAVVEDVGNGSVVGTVTASDSDSPVTGFAIVGGDSAGVFGIDSTGVLSVVDIRRWM